MMSVHRNYPNIAFFFTGNINEKDPNPGEVFGVARRGFPIEILATILPTELIERILNGLHRKDL